MKRNANIITGLGLLVCAAVLLGGCRARQEDEQPEAPLALVNDVAITQVDFDFEVQRRMASGRPIPGAEAVLDELIERELMLQEARASERLQDPGVQRELENQMLVAWLDEALHARKDQVRVTEDELQAAYEEGLDAFTRPALVRLAVLYRKRTALDPGETLVNLAEALEQARAAYLQDSGAATHHGRLQGFGTLAAEHSEHTVSRYRGGDLGWFDPARGLAGIPDTILRAGLALSVGEVSDVLVADDGVYVVLKTGEREAQVTPYEEAAVVLRRRLIREQQARVEQHFRTALREDADISVHTGKVDALVVPSAEASSTRQAPIEMRTP